MKSQFKLNLIKALSNKKSNKGFTLIELLVVVIIIGVLAAVALPNLLGQVGKARETEGKNGVGTINRAQQAYHFERQSFAPLLNDAALQANNALGVIVASDYYDFATTAGTSLTVSVATTAINATRDGVRNYAGAVAFTPANSQYSNVVCQEEAVGAGAPVANANGAACTTGTPLQ